ncbi:hypothetical protein D9M71_841010 [compost metagenome]
MTASVSGISHNISMLGGWPSTRNTTSTATKSSRLLRRHEPTAITGSAIRGNLIFFMRFPFSMKTFRQRPTISANRFQARIPAIRYSA